MAGHIPESFIDELLARTDIVELISARVPLKKVGRNFVARCPFHDEKTPSFTVSPDKQFYHCFGCGASGSAIRFLMEYEHLSFPEAVEALAAHCGLQMPQERNFQAAEDAKRRHQQQALYQLNQEVAAFYARQLKGPSGRAAVAYLRRRGVDEKTAGRYGLGYAPAGWETLSQHFKDELLEQAGLVIAKEDGRRYARFRHRLMFPIRNRRGQVVGFGGRALDEAQSPKYLNSPETEVFNKSREVYGLYEALQAGGRPQRILVVEGYLDVIALAQYGIPYAVAILGTAVTSEHTRLLFRYAEELMFCFDGDAAGYKAAWRALEAVLPQLESGRKVSFLWLPQGEDPDSLIRKEGAEGFTRRLRQAEPLSVYFFRALSEGLNLAHLEDKLVLRERARPLLQRLPNGEFRRMMQSRLAELAGSQPVEKQAYQNPARQRFPSLSQPSLEERIAALLLHHPQMFTCLPREFLQAAKAGRYGELLAHLLVMVEGIKVPTPESVAAKLLSSPHGVRLQELLGQKELQILKEPEKELREAIAFLEQKAQRARLKELTRKADAQGLSEAEKAELRSLMANLR
jgi:DNA primase